MKKIQTKIMILVILATLGVSVVNVALSTAISRRSTLTALEQTLTETTDLAALAARNMIETYTLTIAEIASSPILTSELSSDSEKQDFLQTKVDAYFMRFAGMADLQGKDAILGTDVSGEPFFQAAVQGGSYMSTPYTQNGEMYLVVRSEERRVGKECAA